MSSAVAALASSLAKYGLRLPEQSTQQAHSRKNWSTTREPGFYYDTSTYGWSQHWVRQWQRGGMHWQQRSHAHIPHDGIDSVDVQDDVPSNVCGYSYARHHRWFWRGRHRACKSKDGSRTDESTREWLIRVIRHCWTRLLFVKQNTSLASPWFVLAPQGCRSHGAA